MEHSKNELAGVPEVRTIAHWLTLAVGSLILAGFAASLLVIGRIPWFSRFIGDPAFFRRCLVVHVDLSLVVWLYAFIAGLIFLLPGPRQSTRFSRSGVFVSTSGVAMMLCAAGVRGAEPILANYVPLIDHWLFGIGLVLFGAGVVTSLLDRRLLPWASGAGSLLALPDAAIVGLRATAVAVLLAALTFANAWLVAPSGLSAEVRYELLLWGGGHVLQMASTAAMLSVWLILVAELVGRSPMSRSAASAVFGWLVLPWTVAPLLPLRGLQDGVARELFTDLMRWGIFPPSLIVLVLCVRALLAARRQGRLTIADLRFIGFVASALLTLLGYILGALIISSTTTVPAHYHAAIGAVTAAFMTISYSVLEALGISSKWHRVAARLTKWQPALFGSGQAVFALGFAIAGAHGSGRKIYASEGHVTSVAQAFGLGVMGLGGLLAIVGGVLYLALVVAAWRHHERLSTNAWLRPAPLPGGSHG